MLFALLDTELIHEPLKYSGSLDHLKFIEMMPIIGREYTTTKIKDVLHASNAERQVRDLAVITSERGVYFFRAPQDDLGIEELKKFTDLVGKLSGKPKKNGLHVHPLYRDPANVSIGNGETDETTYA